MADKNKVPASSVNYDNSFIGKLLIAAENPDSIGYRNKRWYAPKKRGYDSNNFGIGVDRQNAKEYLQTDANGEEYLTEADERNLRNKLIEGTETSLKKRETFATQTTGLENNASEATKAKVQSYIYNMGSSNVANSAFNEKLNELSPSIWYKFMENYLNDNLDGVINAINSDYKRQGKYERIKNENNFFKNNLEKKEFPHSYLDIIDTDMNYLNMFKNGSRIHIKKKNRGKFTKSAKAAGEGVQEHAHKVMNDPNATPLQRRRANFTIQTKKWHHKHEDGGLIQYGKVGLELDPQYMFFSSEAVNKPERKGFDYSSFFTTNSPIIPAASTSTSTTSNPWDGYKESTGESSTQGAQAQSSAKGTRSTTRYSDRNKFVSDLTSAYTAAGFNPELVKLMVAQDALETGWGKSPVGDYNFGNIKAMGWNGGTKSAYDKVEKSTSAYRSYKDLNEYIADKIDVLSRVYGISADDSAEQAISKMNGSNPKGRKYASSPTYAQALTKTYQSLV